MEKLLTSTTKLPKNKTLIVFDLDGTLTESKSAVDSEMALLLSKLLKTKMIAVIGGGKFQLFERQLLYQLSVPEKLLFNLFLFPVTATEFYKYKNGNWEEVYSQNFSKEEKEKIMSAFQETFKELGYINPEKVYGDLIEDRGGQVTFSALGQNAPADLKEKWHKENPETRLKMETVLQKRLPDMEVKVAGLTSIDVTHRGIDKNYGIKQISKYLNVSLDKILFVGDNFSHEGNDEPVLKTGVLCFEVKNTEDTKGLIKYLISN